MSRPASVLRVLITGGSGFVGTNLVDFYSSRGHEVRSLDIRPPRNRDHTPYWMHVNLLDKDTLVSAVREHSPSILHHLAARTDLAENCGLSGYAVNIDGVSNVVEAVRQTPSVRRVVLASTQLVCRIGYRPERDDEFAPNTLYGESKVIGEKIIREADWMDVAWTIVRPTSLWGPWFAEPYRDLFRLIERGWYVHAGRTNPVKQWGYVGNIVHELGMLAEAPTAAVIGRTFYVADYQPVSLVDFTNRVQEELGASSIHTVPIGLLRLIAQFGDWARRLGYSHPPLTTSRLRNILAAEIQDTAPLEELVGPLPYTMEEGVRATVSWIRSRVGEGAIVPTI